MTTETPPAPEGVTCPLCAKTGVRFVLDDEAALAQHRAEAHAPTPAADSPARGADPGPQPAVTPGPPATPPIAPDDAATRLQQLENLGKHLTSEIFTLRASIDRLLDSADDTSQRNAATVTRLEEVLGVLRARLEAQEQQTLGERLRRVEEETGIVAKRPPEIDGLPGTPDRPPKPGDDEGSPAA